MSDNKEVARRVVHYLSRLQSRVLAVENAQSKRPGLHWGQFVMEGQPNSQVGVYGSACAAFILRLARRDDASARSAVAGVEAFLNARFLGGSAAGISQYPDQYWTESQDNETANYLATGSLTLGARLTL